MAKKSFLENLLGSFSGTSGRSRRRDDLAETGGDLFEGIGDAISDITGLGASNKEASETASMTGVEKSSASVKKKKKPAVSKSKPSSVRDKAAAARERVKNKSGVSRSSSSKKKIIP